MMRKSASSGLRDLLSNFDRLLGEPTGFNDSRIAVVREIVARGNEWLNRAGAGETDQAGIQLVRNHTWMYTATKIGDFERLVICNALDIPYRPGSLVARTVDPVLNRWFASGRSAEYTHGQAVAPGGIQRVRAHLASLVAEALRSECRKREILEIMHRRQRCNEMLTFDEATGTPCCTADDASHIFELNGLCLTEEIPRGRRHSRMYVDITDFGEEVLARLAA